MTRERLRALLREVRAARVAVLGDFCLDAYWFLDPALSERSIETGRPTRPVRRQRYSPGGAGNAAANLAALGAGAVRAIGVLGDDLFGRELRRLLDRMGVSTAAVLTQAGDWDTPVYAKPHVADEEQDRLDFGLANRLHAETEQALLRAIETAGGEVSVLVVNQQLLRGVCSDPVVAAINALAARWEGTVLVDARNRSEAFTGVAFRLNANEAARAFGGTAARDGGLGDVEARTLAERIHARTGRPVFLSLGERGSVVAAADGAHTVSSVAVAGPTDPVGAGDSSLSAITAALAVGTTPRDAAELAALAAAVTVGKLRTTGTATPDEILALAAQAV